jgi:YihY family inner membrane protein
MRGAGVLGPWPRAFWDRAYKENITGLAGMVAYNLMLAIFPFALLILFGFGQFADSGGIEHSVVLDLERLFPNVEQATLMNAIDRVRESSTTLGVAAVVGGVWIGSSFWGAMDTAFCRIYHVECRGWIEQKRFSLVMLLALTLLIAASVVIPTLEGAAISSTENLPFGLSDFGAVRSVILIGAGLLISFGVVCAIYWAVPKGHLPWHSVWPGALFFTLATGIGNYAFPFYLTNISTLDRLGGTIGFILVALLWFYAISLALLAGAVINALRHELHATGAVPEIPPDAARTEVLEAPPQP